MGILSAIFGSSKNTETLVDGAVKGIDKLVFTEEEKSEYTAKAADWFLRYLEASQPQNMARRLIAMVVVGVWAFVIALALGAKALEEYVASMAGTDFSSYVMQVMTDVVLAPFGIIVGFYFLTHTVRAYGQAKSPK